MDNPKGSTRGKERIQMNQISAAGRVLSPIFALYDIRRGRLATIQR